MAQKLTTEFYLRDDVLNIAQELLGKVLITRFACPNSGAMLTSGGIIVETEAYKAPEDKASHAYGNRRTKRTETMFQRGGIAYVYLCYGMYNLFNVVTGPKDLAHAILIRAIEPVIGIEHMLQRRKHNKINYKLSAGPGVMSIALGITTAHDQTSLNSKQIWIEDHDVRVNKIQKSPRIGVAYAQEYAQKPWRFSIATNPWVSKGS